jgi:diaminopimelate epimerase
VARVLVVLGEVQTGASFPVRTDSGLLTVSVVAHDARRSEVLSSLGVPELERAAIPMTGVGSPVLDVPLDVLGKTVTVCALRLGNPCCVVWTDDVDGEDLARLGPILEAHEVFPRHANVAFVEVVSRTRLRQRTWERGVGAETFACGTGAGASAVAAILSGRAESSLTIGLEGGDLSVQWPGPGAEVLLRGPATTVFEGTWPWR